VINGGALNVGPNDAMRLAYCAGCEGELILNGGVVTLTNPAAVVGRERLRR
jgi:hypothetical protein